MQIVFFVKYPLLFSVNINEQIYKNKTIYKISYRLMISQFSTITMLVTAPAHLEWAHKKSTIREKLTSELCFIS